MRNLCFALLTTAVLTAAAPVRADGMIVPVREDIRVRGHWAVKYHHVDIRVRDQVASVSIDQKFVNTGSGMIEVEYLFPVPPHAAIDSLTLMVDGQEFAAKLYQADEARKIYENIVRRKKDPALLEYVNHGLYKTSAFPLQPGKPARVVITYKDTCKKDRDTVEVWYPLNTEKFSAKPLDDVRVTVDIQADSDITAVYSPTHDLDVDRKSAGRVVATYHETDALPTTDFQVFYKAADEQVGATFLTHQPNETEDGYFLMLVSPNPQAAKTKVQPKDIVLVMDHSGSMNGEKLRQTKEGMRQILNSLNPDDRFSVVAYNDAVRAFFDKLAPADGEHVREAIERLDAIDATGGTNIGGALEQACKLVAGSRESRPRYILFLTDGKPTVGETDHAKLLAALKQHNTAEARIFTFGVGYNVNVRLLDQILADHRGRGEYVKPSEPVETKVSALYNKIRNPVMTDLSVRVDGLAIKDTYPREMDDLFEGDQIVVAGRYDHIDARDLPVGDGRKRVATLIIRGEYLGRQRVFEYPVSIQPAGSDSRYDFVEKLWAIRRVGYLMDEIQRHGESQELIDELVRLSRNYGIMTPYTSFLAEETEALARTDALRDRFRQSEMGRGLSSDADRLAGQTHASNKRQYMYARKAPKAAAPESAAGGYSAGAELTTTGDGVQMLGAARPEAYDRGQKGQVIRGVRQIGNYALYRRGQQWVMPQAAGVDLQNARNVQTIERYSKEYFALVRANTAAQNRLLATQREGEELVLELRGQVYQIR